MASPPSFGELCQLKYKDQAIWFLNGFWADGIKEHAETIWDRIHLFIDLDRQSTPPKGADGNELDQFWSAKFIEETEVDEDGHKAAMTALERKEIFRTIDQDSNGKMAALEYLVWKFQKGVEETCKSLQGDNSAALAEAQAKMDEVAQAMEELIPKVESAKNAAAAAKQAEEDAKKAEEDARAAEAAAKEAEAELAAAVDELHAQEDAYHGKIAELETTSKDESLGVVKRNKAANQLEQLKAEDPLPLRKAKITQGAALKKAGKQRKQAEAATEAAAAAVAKAEAATADAEKTAQEMEEAYQNLEKKMEEAEKDLQEARLKGGPAMGAIWWMERELFEADKKLPRSKQKYDHTKPFQFKD